MTLKPAGRELDHQSDNADMLLVINSRRFPGGADQGTTPSTPPSTCALDEALQRRFVKRTVFEGRHYSCVSSCKHGSDF